MEKIALFTHKRSIWTGLFEVDDIGYDGDDDLSYHYLPNFKQLLLGFWLSERGTKIRKIICLQFPMMDT